MAKVKPPGVTAFETVDGVVLPARDLATLYDTDEHGWFRQQAAVLRSGSLVELDCLHLAEFLNDMATRDRHELCSKFGVLLLHLLKFVHQPSRISAKWIDTIDREQVEIKERVESASLCKLAPELYARAWALAVRGAARGTGLPIRSFPTNNPWTMHEALTFALPADDTEGARFETTPVAPAGAISMSIEQDACREQARNEGCQDPEREWILTAYDTWERNPYYVGTPGRHPEDDRDDEPAPESGAHPAVVIEDADIPF